MDVDVLDRHTQGTWSMWGLWHGCGGRYFEEIKEFGVSEYFLNLNAELSFLTWSSLKKKKGRIVSLGAGGGRGRLSVRSVVSPWLYRLLEEAGGRRGVVFRERRGRGREVSQGRVWREKEKQCEMLGGRARGWAVQERVFHRRGSNVGAICRKTVQRRASRAGGREGGGRNSAFVGRVPGVFLWNRGGLKPQTTHSARFGFSGVILCEPRRPPETATIQREDSRKRPKQKGGILGGEHTQPTRTSSSPRPHTQPCLMFVCVVLNVCCVSVEENLQSWGPDSSAAVRMAVVYLTSGKVKSRMKCWKLKMMKRRKVK